MSTRIINLLVLAYGLGQAVAILFLELRAL